MARVARSLPPAASDQQAAQQVLAESVLRAARRQWALLGDDFDAGWRSIGPRLYVLLTAAQMRAASDAAAAASLSVAQVGLDAAMAGRTATHAFARSASDGRPLMSLLYEAVIASKVAMVGVDSPEVARAAGWSFLQRAVPTQVADAARASSLVTMTATPTVTGYVRVVEPGACSRCAILAGKHFSWDNDFRRHPRCHCSTCPSGSGEARVGVTSPEDHFAGLSREEQDRVYGPENAEAIRLGASPITVVNANRGTYTPTGRRAPTPSARPMPGDLLAEAGGDREKAVALLRQHGFLT